MARGPIDFLAGLQRPSATFQALSQLGSALGERRERIDRNALIAQQQEAAAAERARQEAAVQGLTALKNPTFEDYNKVALLLPKDRADSVRASFGQMNKEQQSSQLAFNGEVMAALDFNPEIAIDILNERAAAERNSGDEAEAIELERLAEAAKTKPQDVKTFLGTTTAFLPGGRGVIDSLTKLREGRDVKGGAVNVQSSEILPDGTVQIVTKEGKTDVLSPTEAQKKLIKEARQYGAEIQGLRAGERDSAKNAQKISIDFFKQLEPISTNIANLNEGIRLIDEGAETGPIAKFFPSIREASVKLDNLQGKLGLDVLRTTTFGALSEKELAFALDTALPTKLEGPALKDWLRRKRDSQQKLMNFYSEAAIHLGIPGNNISEFLDKKKAEQGEPEGAVQAPPAQAAPSVAEGTIIKNAKGERMVLRGGQWQPL